jgi:hypothetical protein
MSAAEKYGDVFAAHPSVDMLYVVEGMPFLEESLALGHKASLDMVRQVHRQPLVQIEVVERPVVTAAPVADVMPAPPPKRSKKAKAQ